MQANDIQKPLFRKNISEENDSSLIQNVIEQAGKYDGKEKKNISLASHLINATLIGLNAYAYDQFAFDDGNIENTEAKLLTSALILHDVNKYVNERYGGYETKSPSKLLEKYFEDDDFKVKEFLNDENLERFNDLLYLIQRTEVDDCSNESRGHSEFSRLVRYCRIGDAVASKITKEGVREGYRDLKEKRYSSKKGDHVHLLELETIEQPILNNHVIGLAKEIIEEKDNNIVLGSSIDKILYLGDEVSREDLKNKIKDRLPDKIISKSEEDDGYEFKGNVTQNDLSYGLLNTLSFDKDRKKDILKKQFIEFLKDGPSDPDKFEYFQSFEEVPDVFRKYALNYAKAIFRDNKKEFSNEKIQELWKKTYKELGSPQQAGQKIKVEFTSRFLNRLTDNQDFQEFLSKLEEENDSEIDEELEIENNSFDIIVNRIFGKKDTSEPGKEDKCFICGRKAKSAYSSKDFGGFFKKQAFSRRVPPNKNWDKKKKICSICKLEYAIFDDEFGEPGKDCEVAYIYYDDFIGDVKLYQSRFSDVLEGEDSVLDNPEAQRGLMSPQFHIQPFYVNDKNSRMKNIKNIIEKIRKFGMKVTIGNAFTRFETKKDVFFDENPLRVQETLGFEKFEAFKDLKKPLNFFELLDTVDNHYFKERNSNISNKYLQVQSGNFVELVDFALVNEYKQSKDGVLRQYLEKYNGEEFMQMKDVAKKGADLTENYPNSKYKKTKIFREALDALMTGKSQDISDLEEHVKSQVHAVADREQYVDATLEKVEAFVEAIFNYLKENELDGLKKLSDWENALVNSYYYSFETITQGDN